MTNSFLFYFIKISAKIVLDFLYFPVWWYSVGLVRTVGGLGLFLREKWIIIGAGVWLKNLFTPMYGQSDFTSRAISFFVRLVQIIFRFIAFIFFSLLALIALILWLIFPVAVVYSIINNLYEI